MIAMFLNLSICGVDMDFLSLNRCRRLIAAGWISKTVNNIPDNAQ
jgi:hypothetical protein